MSEGTFESAAADVDGHVKEAAGKVTGDGELEAEGQRRQSEADGPEQDETETDASGNV